MRVADERGWRTPSYSSVRDIVRRIDQAMLTLAHEGAAAFRDKYEKGSSDTAPIARTRSGRPTITELDILILDAHATPARPWLTTVVDDHSRVIAATWCFSGRRPWLIRRSRCVRPYSARPIRHGRSAASPTWCTSITDRTSPACTLNRPQPISVSDYSTRPSLAPTESR